MSHINNSVEQLFISCSVSNFNFIIGGVYISPNSPNNCYLSHVEMIEDLRIQYNKCNFYIFGDFNLPNITSDLNNISPSQMNENISSVAQCYAFLDFKQHITIPNSNNKFLDLLFSNVDSILVSSAIDPIFSESTHHKPYSFDLPISDITNNLLCQEFYDDFRNVDYISLQNYLGPINWHKYLNLNDINTAVHNFYHIMSMALNLFVPKKKSKVSTFPKWFNAELRNLIIQKKIAHKNYKNTGNRCYYIEFSKLRSQCNILSKECFVNYKKDLENNFNTDPRSFWRFFSRKNNLYDVPNNMYLADKKAVNGDQISELFAVYFSEVYASSLDVSYHDTFNNYSSIKCDSLTAQVIYDGLSKLSNNLTARPDGLPDFFLKNCAYSLTQPLFVLYNLSLKLGILPDKWKTSHLNIENYR
uniref:Uncharacterized protein LOC114347995 n=1 Tax=Diabrotica virgifera virgifera TaxID=50390 RepID=A0A6P7H9W2_DIAVI